MPCRGALVAVLAIVACKREMPQAEPAATVRLPDGARETERADPADEEKTAEAKEQLTRMTMSAIAFFEEEQLDQTGASAKHACPNDGRPIGSVGPTPPLSLECAAGPKGRCVPLEKPEGPGSYPVQVWWDDRGAWNALDFQMETPHYFHYAFSWSNAETGYGACKSTAQALGDLDADGVYSTFERVNELNEDGVISRGLSVEHEHE